MEGVGVFTWPDGTQFHGSWSSNRMHGIGTMVFRDGTRFHGNWINNTIEGFGTLKWHDGSVHQGFWHNNARHQWGSFMWNNDGLQQRSQWPSRFFINRWEWPKVGPSWFERIFFAPRRKHHPDRFPCAIPMPLFARGKPSPSV